MDRRQQAWFVVMVAVVLAVPAMASAQSGIAGVVRDPSGAVLPGVTVEAASPVLIEKVRTVVTDNEGAYRLLDLRPGAYTITFSLEGFASVKREGIDLPAAFTATVSVELSLGSVREVITVSGAAPAVDVRNATSSLVLAQELLAAIPAVRSPQGFAALTPGVTSAGITSVGGGREEMNTATHGANVFEAVYLVDGVNTGEIQAAGGANTVFRISQSYVSEINIVTGGGTAEQQFGGTVTNIIPRQGGNVFSGLVYADYTGQRLQTTNLTDALKAQGFTRNGVSGNEHLWEASPAIGGPILRDKLWFFGSYRNAGTIQTRAGIYENLTPLGWSYTPDTTRPAVIKITDESKNARLTWQVSPKNQIAAFADFQPHIVWNRNYQFPVASEATTYTPYLPNALKTLKWKSPLTNRLLLDATYSHHAVDFNLRRQPGVAEDVISAVEATTGFMFRSSSNLGTGSNNYGHFNNRTIRYSANASYITGSHAAKGGLQLVHGSEWFSEEPNGSRAYQLRNGLPISIRQYADPIRWENAVHPDLGLYGQDQWTLKRLTLTGGVRWDYLRIGYAEQNLPAGRWVPARSYPETVDAVNWKDISPRMAASFDVFGDGKTAVKVSLNRFVSQQGAGQGGINNNNPVVRSVLSVDRTWSDLNRDFNPDCDLRDPLANGECGRISDLNFGQNNPNATTYAEELLRGLRNYNWETTVVGQRELMRGISVTAGYYRRVYANFAVNDNEFVAPGDFSEYCITAPTDARLPGSGAQICGLYDVSPTLFGRNRTVVRDDSHYGKREQVYDGVDLTETIKIPNGATISGGVNFGRTRTSACFVVDSPGELRFCEVAPPFQPNATFVGFYPLPWFGLMTSATYRNFPGPQITASYTVSNGQIAPSLGRDLAAGANGTVNVQLIEPGTMFSGRQQQVDFRFSKRQAVGRTRLTANIDLFNLFNAAGIVTLNTTYGPNWQRPTLLQGARFVKFSAQLDF